MEIKYYGLNEDTGLYNVFESALFKYSKDYLNLFANNKDLFLKVLETHKMMYDSTKDEISLNDILIRNIPFFEQPLLDQVDVKFRVFENGIIISLNKPYPHYSIRSTIRSSVNIVVKDDELSYVVTGIVGDREPYGYTIPVQKDVNVSVMEEMLESLGNEIIIPSEGLFNKNKRKKSIATSKAIISAYFDELYDMIVDKKVEIVKQVLSEKQLEEKKNQRINKIKEQLKDIFIKNYELEKELCSLENKSITRKKVLDSVLFKEVNGHLVISDTFLVQDRLKYVDFSSILFDNVDVRGIDFRGTNARIDPQTVYNKDISGCDFTGYDFGFASFDGVNITNTKLDKSVNFVFRDIDKAIVNETAKENNDEIINIDDYSKIIYYGACESASLAVYKESKYLEKFDVLLKLIAQNRNKIVGSLKIHEYDKNNNSALNDCMYTADIPSILGLDANQLLSQFRVCENGILIELSIESSEGENKFNEGVNVYIKDDGISYVVTEESGLSNHGDYSISYVNKEAKFNEQNLLGNEIIIPNKNNALDVKNIIYKYLYKLYVSTVLSDPIYVDGSKNENVKLV